MTAAVPDPRFRDQLDRAAWKAVQEESWATGVAMLDSDVAAFTRRLVTDLLPLVEARVQAAAKQRAAEELRAAADQFSTVGLTPFELRARAAAVEAATEEGRP